MTLGLGGALLVLEMGCGGAASSGKDAREPGVATTASSTTTETAPAATTGSGDAGLPAGAKPSVPGAPGLPVPALSPSKGDAKPDGGTTPGPKQGDSGKCDTADTAAVLGKLMKDAEKAIEHAKDGDLRTAATDLQGLKNYLDGKGAKKPCGTGEADVSKAITDAKLKEKEAQTLLEQGEKKCLGGAHCFYIGAYVGAASFVWASLDTQHGGSAGHGLASAALPVAGYRYALYRDAVWLDVGIGSAVLTKDLTAGDDTTTGCRVEGASQFEARLPCRGNASLMPIAFAFPAVTFGKEELGFLTLMPLFGVAQTSLDGGILPFLGVSVGALGLTKSFVIKSPLK